MLSVDSAGRDGFPSDPEHIFLTAGASAGVSQLLNVALSPGDGVLVPIPQYPLYTATLAALSCHPVPYQLQESSGWSLSQPVLQAAIDSVDRDKTPIKALVVINPGNPTGGCLEEKDMREIVRMCHDQGLVLMADEVYQTNIYYPETKPFVSFKKVLREMEREQDGENPITPGVVELISFHSLSKGVSGECGRRGGYFELVNIDEQVVDQIYKMASISLCPPVTGQVGVDLLVDPPKPGEPSYAQFEKETNVTHQSLLDRSAYMSEKFNALPGMSCQKAEGAMYLFPSIEMPDKALKEAEKRGKPADVMYALDLLGRSKGLCWVVERWLTSFF
jgi:alanine transaminase